MSTPALRAEGVRKSFGNDGVVDDVDLSVEPGEILLLMGPNGVGKTVLLSCLAGSSRPSSGTVTVDGRTIGEDGGETLSFMLQNAMSIGRLTGRENARFYSRLHPRFTDRWREDVAAFELDDDLDKLVENYSEGMTRKLELALTLSVDVPLYLLDEPTAGIDLAMLQRFHDRILDANDEGKTFVIASHRPQDAELADRIAFMVDGTVTATGPPDELLASVPPVVRVAGPRAATAAKDHFVGGELFHAGSEARGFLDPESDVSDIKAVLADAESSGSARVTTADPTYTDLFNYHVHLDGETN